MGLGEAILAVGAGERAASFEQFPLRLSYRHALLALRAFWHTAWLTPPGALPRRIDALLDDLALFVLPARRARRYPRAVKLKISRYRRKRPLPLAVPR